MGSMPEPGTLVAGRYRILRKLGSGGMAAVYAAEDETLKRAVALKVLHVPTDESGARLRREAKLGAGLRHPALVTVFDVLMEGPSVVLVMELVDGPSLAQVIGERRLSPEETLEILRPVADALDHAHEVGVIHRDIKPANILIGPGGAELADLGIAHALESTRITAHGSVVGTPAYMAPEQLQGDDPSAAVDVYALSAVAFEMLAGRPARRGRTTLEIIDALRADPPDLRQAWPEAPAAAAELLQRALSSDPAERPRSASELVDQLAAALAPAPPASLTPPVPASRTPPVAPPSESPANPPVGSDPRRVAASPTRAVESDPRRGRGLAEPRRRRGLSPLPVMLALLGIAAVAGVLILSSGGDGDRAPARAERTPEPTATATAEATPTTEATPGKRREPAPARAIRGFYEAAAADDFDRAWELAGPQYRQQYGSPDGIASGLGSLQRIRFRRLRVVERTGDQAVVEVATVATHTDRVDRCSGTLRAVKVEGTWRADPLGLTC